MNEETQKLLLTAWQLAGQLANLRLRLVMAKVRLAQRELPSRRMQQLQRYASLWNRSHNNPMN